MKIFLFLMCLGVALGAANQTTDTAKHMLQVYKLRGFLMGMSQGFYEDTQQVVAEGCMDNDAISILASVYESTLRYQGVAKQLSLAFTLFSFV